MHKVIYQVSGMRCGGCLSQVKHALAALADEVEVTLDPPQAILTNPKQPLDQLNAALSQVGRYVLTAS
ncbi:MAG TPA: hypothetical protein VGD04_09125 [Methylophilus sp.]